MRFEIMAQLGVEALLEEFRKLSEGGKLVFGSILRIALVSLGLVLRVSGAFFKAMVSQAKLKVSISPNQVQELDSWQKFGEIRVQLISLH